MLDIQSTALSDVLILTPRRFDGDRGWFREVWNAGRMRSTVSISSGCRITTPS